MISDTLFDAVRNIEDYQQVMPEFYAECAVEIGVVTTVMDALRMVFDSPPDLSEEHDKLVEELRSAIRSIKVSGVLAARDRFLAWVAHERERLNDEKGTDR